MIWFIMKTIVVIFEIFGFGLLALPFIVWAMDGNTKSKLSQKIQKIYRIFLD